MKKGKTTKLSGFKLAKVIYGTVDSRKIKSIYINLQTWAEPIDELVTNWQRVVLNMSRTIKHQILEVINKTIFQDNFIVDLDLRTSGIQQGKKSFMNLEITLFTKESYDFKSMEIKNSVRELVNYIYVSNIIKNKYFDFTLTKKDTNQTIFVMS